LQSLDNLGDTIIESLGKSRAIGSTARQVSVALGVPEEIVTKEISRLERAGKIHSFGRGLWLPANLTSISNIEGFVPSSFYELQFKEDFRQTTFAPFKINVTFSPNMDRAIHRWSSYVQGFSADFVDHVIENAGLGRRDVLLDCFSGSGTSTLCAKLKGIDAIGLDLSPLMSFVSRTKTRLERDFVRIEEMRRELEKTVAFQRIAKGKRPNLPFLKETRNHFSTGALESLSFLKQSIMEGVEDDCIRDLLLLAFTSVLVECSNLKRSPCLGYAPDKVAIDAEAPYSLFVKKVDSMIKDLEQVQRKEESLGKVEIMTGDSTSHKYKEDSVNLAITSPPYANGMDYVTNYKIELAWLGAATSYEDLRSLRDRMVASDNVSRGSLSGYFDKRSPKVRDLWLESILLKIRQNVSSKKTFRRSDMHLVIQKYFEDMYDTLQNVYEALLPGGKFVLVIGDSLTAGVYLPTDLLMARIGNSIGFKVQDVEFARTRRSGQRRSFKLRESIVTLVKN
jgi:DNA modification methylase